MAVLRVAHVWGDRLLDVRHLAGSGAFGPLKVTEDRIRIDGEAISLTAGKRLEVPIGATALRLSWVEPQPPARGLSRDTDWSFAKLLACLLLLSAALVAMFFIQADLGFSETSLAWVVNAYLLTFGGFLLLGGRLGDLFGHRRMFLIGIAAFTCASVGCGLGSRLESGPGSARTGRSASTSRPARAHSRSRPIRPGC